MSASTGEGTVPYAGGLDFPVPWVSPRYRLVSVSTVRACVWLCVRVCVRACSRRNVGWRAGSPTCRACLESNQHVRQLQGELEGALAVWSCSRTSAGNCHRRIWIFCVWPSDNRLYIGCLGPGGGGGYLFVLYPYRTAGVVLSPATHPILSGCLKNNFLYNTHHGIWFGQFVRVPFTLRVHNTQA